MTLDKKRVTVSGGELAVVDEGDGPAVVLLHGFPTSSHLWRDLAPILAPRFRAIAPDLLGYGDSDKPEDSSALTIRAQAGYVRELMEALGVDEFAVAGHDIGGGVAQLLALEGGVRTMVLLDSIAFDSWPIEGVRMLQEGTEEQTGGDFAEGVVRLTFDLGMGRRERLADEDLQEYLRPWRADPLALIRAVRGIDGIGLLGTEARMAELDTRTLVVWGEDDPFQPSDIADRLGEALPGATVAILPGCSHFVLDDAVETVAPLISEYLKVHYLGERHGHGGPVGVDLDVSFERPGPEPEHG